MKHFGGSMDGMQPCPTITGAELRRLRKAAGLNQSQLAKKAGPARGAVSYWENKALVEIRHGAPKAFMVALGIEFLPYSATSTRERGDGVLFNDPLQEALDRISARALHRLEQQAARYRQPCEARTRKGKPCRNMSEAGRRRCKFHGGMSTGPKTQAGKDRIAAAQRKRWAKWRADRLIENPKITLRLP